MTNPVNSEFHYKVVRVNALLRPADFVYFKDPKVRLQIVQQLRLARCPIRKRSPSVENKNVLANIMARMRK